MAQLKWVLIAVPAYIVTLSLIQRAVAPALALSKKQLRPLVAAHNALLVLWSAAVLVPMAYYVGGIVRAEGLFHAMCSPRVLESEALWSLIYLNYAAKFYELLDTVFLALKRRPLTFLHVFHHSATLVLCYTQIRGRTSVQWLPITLNCIVHVVMYTYYGLVTLGIRVTWKKALTTLQITQFVLDVFACYYCVYVKAFTPSDCNGSMPEALFGCFILTLYLGLFIQFFVRTYVSKPSNSQKVK